ncbi:hypothetical protein ACSBR1_024096 [Camellia fascicularis]
MEATQSQLSEYQNQQPRDTYNIAYSIFFLLGAGNLIPWNSFVTAVDYFEYLYPDKHIDKVFSVAYMGSSLTVLALMMCFSSWSKLPGFKLRMNIGQALFVITLMTALVTDWIAQANHKTQVKHDIGYMVIVTALVVCGLADGLAAGSLIGAAGELPGQYMQACIAGNASSGILVCILRIVTKASLPHSPKGLQMSTQIYFIISTFIVFMCIICSNILEKLPENPVDSNRDFMIYVVTLSIFPGYLTEDVKSRFFQDWYPILLITTYNLMGFLGKSLTAIYIPKKITGETWACFARLLLYPLFIVCVHGPKSPRSELPVVFLTATLGFTNGYLTSVPMILAPKLVPVEESEIVGIVMSLFLVIGLATGSVLGWLWNI